MPLRLVRHPRERLTVLRRTTVASVVLALTAAVLGTTLASAEDSFYPDKGNDEVDVLKYGLDLSWSPGNKTLSGTATLRARALGAGEMIALDLHQSMTVSSVMVDAVETPFVHEGKDLIIGPVVMTAPEHDVIIKYAGKPRTVKAPTTRPDTTGVGWHTTPKGQVWTMQKPFGAFTWYPVNDHPSDKAQYTVRLNVPDKWTGVSNGVLSSKVTLAGRTITEFTSGQPMAPHLVTVAIGPYAKYSQTGPRNIPLTYWYPKGKTELLAPLKKTPKTLAWLESKLGPYPFPRAGVVITPGKSSVESQTMITLAKSDYKYGGADVQQQIAHNLAHHWYGNTVTPNDWRDLWMSEGMATYLEAKFTVSRGWDSWSFWKREFARNDNYYRELYGAPGDYHLNDFGQRNVHYGGALMLHRLRAVVGAKTFDAAMREWPQKNLNSSRGRGAYISFMEAKSGKDLGSFFQAWLMSDTTP